MKFTLSFTTTYLLFGISYCIAINENSDSTIGISKQENIRRIPTHIIKFKAPSIKNITGFESTAFVQQHYKTFQEGLKSSLKGKHALMSDMAQTSDEDMKLELLKDIQIGDNYRALTGSFHPQFVNYLSNIDDIEFIEQNQIYKAPFIPPTIDPKIYMQDIIHKVPNSKTKRGIVTQVDVPSWGIARINHRELRDLTVYTADDTAGTGIHVYILDSGIDESHPDFEGRALMEANFISYEDSGDFSGHGTHVAGIIGGKAFGVAKKSFLHGIKILDRNGDGTTSALLQAISYIVKTHEPGHSIINLSLSGPRSSSIDEALSMVVQDYDIPVFVSAGNTGDDACDYSPSANPDVFAVGATNYQDVIPSFSSFGECVSIYAPGANITSDWLENKTITMDGTSMASPHVSGIAAMLMSKTKFGSPNDLYTMIKNMGTPNILKPSDKVQGAPLAYNGPEYL
ncbi:hypothetical protein G6F70_000392 [Rhizopus microsporus]|uniref:Subtilisin-like serine protease n=2 Tax=Rhizopus TaxID=4842 RepID=A0A367KEQ0_RHIAZ|nr:hypothetical protein G6F71_000410 [Rhizopus microsporus]RCI00704.1 subtilisin-like serine protease [Rhizopus azygosporus]KAG1204538.1 hypothetical protein G6F70_000392 [Rhizopus microsporus]KAG1216040.1 hypothetical protein G6F69_000467 [Rhizopus microsporus]KAG1238611.1 hypothetical protein G6F67_000304 [Rhizopus microsporus]